MQSVNYSAPYGGIMQCDITARSPMTVDGLGHPTWTEQYRDPTLSEAVQLNAFNGLVCERTANGPTRDDQFFSVVVEHRPVFQLPPEVTMQSDNVPTIFESQVKQSCGFDIGEDQLYTNQDTVVYCAGKR